MAMFQIGATQMRECIALIGKVHHQKRIPHTNWADDLSHPTHRIILSNHTGASPPRRFIQHFLFFVTTSSSTQLDSSGARPLMAHGRVILHDISATQAHFRFCLLVSPQAIPSCYLYTVFFGTLVLPRRHRGSDRR